MEITVYEMVNDRLKQIFVGSTLHDPPELGDWTTKERRNFRVVETFQDRVEAKRFLERYAHWAPPRGWRVVRLP